jgi:hypothetical protein
MAQQVTFTGMVYHRNAPAPYAAVTVDYGQKTYSTKADDNGNYRISMDYAGGGKAVMIASYNGDTDTVTWTPDPDSTTNYDFWIVPRPRPSWSPSVAFDGHVYFNSSPVKDAHVIIVYGSYLLDTYTNDTGYYTLTVYHQGTQARLWATDGKGRSVDYWKNPVPNDVATTDLYITQPSQLPLATPTPAPTAVPGNATPTVEPGAPTAEPGAPTATPASTPAGNLFTGLAVAAMAIVMALFIYNRRP